MEEEIQSVDHDEKPIVMAVDDYRSNVDTSRPFRSVKEAVAIFGERFLVGDIYSPKPFSFTKKETPFFSPSPSPRKFEKEPLWKYSSPSPRGSGYGHEAALADTVKKLETELEETKIELKLLKERESETEVALASLNAELHKNMSKLAQAEAVEAGKAAMASSRLVVGRGGGMDDQIVIREEEEKSGDFYMKKSSPSPSPSLAQILSMSDAEGLFMGRKKEKKVVKKKPIIPLIGEFFSRKKSSSTTLHNPLYASSHLQWN